MTLWLVGVMVLVAGTFLPWIYSGRVAKSSYSITGSLERHLNLPNWAEVIVSGWPFLGPGCAVLIVVFAIGLRRSAAAVSILCFLLIALLCCGLLILGRDLAGPISIAAMGPAVTLIGCALAVPAAGVLVLKRPISAR